ncbi:MAG: sensor histidine kinase KdpD [Gemmatimonadaceae bacterium]|jgi:two-component system sensor histidine kinase KdpD|nr:sensor histidine kinase KdpD [Gemmatimonadaceae bacterium]
MADRARPDPDALLERVTDEAARATRGRLKVFLGAAPGVGKTFTMLEAAHLAHRAGLAVVVGVVETHGRADTARLLEGLPMLPRVLRQHRGVTIEEFDLDAALAQHPALLLIDELAHTNAPGSRHAKRWQDVVELLDAGIDVWTTCNIQHIESLNDVVAQITGVVVRETVPDQVIEGADQVELVDVTPEVLEERLREGKVYRSAQAARALDRFFRRGNLLALRELALRRVAERVDADMAGYRSAAGIDAPWPAAERLLVCIDPVPHAARVARQGALLARRLRAEWCAVYVETPSRATLDPIRRAYVRDALDLAESLGAETMTVPGDVDIDELLALARARNATGLVIGHEPGHAVRAWLGRSRLDRLVRASVGLDVHVVAASDAAEPASPIAPRTTRTPPRQYVEAVLAVGFVTVLGILVRSWLSATDVAMAYLLAIVAVGARARVGPALVAAALATLAFDVAFVPPFYTLAVADESYLLTFAMMFAIGMGMVWLTARLRVQTGAAREREARTAALYALGERLAGARRRDDVVAAGIASVAQAFAADVVLVGADADADVTDDGTVTPTPPPTLTPGERAVARWVRERGTAAGLGTDTLAAAERLWIPIGDATPAIAAMGVRPAASDSLDSPEARRQLETMGRLIGTALDRVTLAGDRARQQREIEAERLRTSLLSSLSHDLRTPLGGIEGAATTLLDDTHLDGATRRDLAQGIVEESRRLARLVGNLLDMVRVESDTLMVQREWQPIEEVIGAALARLDLLLAAHPVTVDLPATPVVAPFDAVLVEQVLANLLENAVKHTADGAGIRIVARASRDAITVSVVDAGAGVPDAELERIFEKFHRVDRARGGVGLGLAICRAIIQAHGGRIWAEHAPGGGLAVHFTIPLVGAPPEWMTVTASPVIEH